MADLKAQRAVCCFLGERLAQSSGAAQCLCENGHRRRRCKLELSATRGEMHRLGEPMQRRRCRARFCFPVAAGRRWRIGMVSPGGRRRWVADAAPEVQSHALFSRRRWPPMAYLNAQRAVSCFRGEQLAQSSGAAQCLFENGHRRRRCKLELSAPRGEMHRLGEPMQRRRCRAMLCFPVAAGRRGRI